MSEQIEGTTGGRIRRDTDTYVEIGRPSVPRGFRSQPSFCWGRGRPTTTDRARPNPNPNPMSTVHEVYGPQYSLVPRLQEA